MGKPHLQKSKLTRSYMALDMTTPMYAKGTTLDLSIYPSFIQYATSVGYPKGNDNRCHKIYDDWYARGTVV